MIGGGVKRGGFAVFVGLILGLSVPNSAAAQSAAQSALAAEAKIASLYLDAAIDLSSQALWPEAAAVLARGADFAAASSDFCYFSAIVGHHLGRPADETLEWLRLALAVNRWTRWTAADALALEAERLVDIRQFDKASLSLRSLPYGADRLYLGLRVLAGLNDTEAFRSEMVEALATFPYDVRFPRLFLEKTRKDFSLPSDRSIIARVLERLSYLVETEPLIAVLAVPFLVNQAERFELIKAYRAKGGDDPRAIVAALELGLLTFPEAVAEFFSGDKLPLETVERLWALAGTDTNRAAFAAAAAGFSAAIIEDADGDGLAESLCRYSKGMVESFVYDADQNGRPEWTVDFINAQPDRGRAYIDMEIVWDEYPRVERVAFEGRVYYPAPAALAYAPLRLEAALEWDGAPVLVFPRYDEASALLTETVLVSHAAVIERPLSEGGMERTELVGSIPLRKMEIIDEVIVSVLRYRKGRPDFSYADLDRDGRFETVRRYDELSGRLLEAEYDWDGDGNAEYAERYDIDGHISYWDLDGDGRRESRVDERQRGLNEKQP